MSDWTVVDEQPLSDWLMPHERADLERAASQAIVGFVPRAELNITTPDGKNSPEARNRRLLRPYRRKTDG